MGDEQKCERCSLYSSRMVLEHRRDGTVAVITLAHPPANALSLALRRALLDFFVAARTDAGIQAIVVRGAGKGFCAGGDRTEFGTPNANERPTLSRDVLDAIERCGKPVVAALHGYAMGGGLELALACGARVAVADTRVALPEVTIGVFPLSATQRLPRVIGVARAAALMLSGASVAASDPAIAGCFDRIVPSGDELLQAALQVAQACVAAPPVLLRARPITDDPVAELQSLLERHAEKELTPAQKALLQALRAAVEAASFQAGLARAQALFDELGGTRRPSPPVR
jgi:3-hydroxyacyl-CoA dehydrogenase